MTIPVATRCAAVAKAIRNEPGNIRLRRYRPRRPWWRRLFRRDAAT